MNASVMHGISLIIPTYNRAPYLRATLDSLRQLQIPEGMQVELIVVDNNCTDDTSSVVDAAIPGFPFPLRRAVEQRQGLCFGRNRGIAEARHEHLGYLDDDIRINPRWVMGQKEAVEKYGADAVVGPVFPLFEGEKPAFLEGRALELISSSYSRKGDEILVLPANLGHELPGCNFGVNKLLAEKIGGFDNTLDRIGKSLLAGGDTEFGKRLVAANRRTVYHPDCSIEHIIVTEKLTKAYLRSRAYGLGATRSRISGTPLRTAKRLRGTLGVGRLAVRTLWKRLFDSRQTAFEFELRTLEALGRYWGVR